MNIELFEGQIAIVRVTIESTHEDYEIYGGTSKGQFKVTGNVIEVPAELSAGCSIPRYDIFARRVSSGQEWRILSGKITTEKRQSTVSGQCISPREYLVTVPIVEGVEEITGTAIAVGIPGERGAKGERGEKGEQGIQGEKGERGFSPYEIAVQHGYEGDEQSFNELLATLAVVAQNAYDAQVLAEVNAINAVNAAQEAQAILNEIKGVTAS